MDFDAAVTLVRHTLRHLQLLDVQALQQACSALSTAVKLYMEQDQPIVWAQVVRNSHLPAGHPLQAVEPASDIPRVAKSLARMHGSIQGGSLSHVSQLLLGAVHKPLGLEAINPQGTLMISRRADCLCLMNISRGSPAPDLHEVGCLPLPEDQRGSWEAVTWAPDGSAVCVFLRTVQGPITWGQHPHKWRGVLCLIPVTDPRLVVIHDPDFAWSEAPLTFTRDSQHLVMPALDAVRYYAEGDNFITYNHRGEKVALLNDVSVFSGLRGASLAHTVGNRVVVACWNNFQVFDVTTWDARAVHCFLRDSHYCQNNNLTCCMGLVAANPAGTLVACMVKCSNSLCIIDAVSMKLLRHVPLAPLDHDSRGRVSGLAWVRHGWLLSTAASLTFPPRFESIQVYDAPKRSRGSLACMQTLQYQWPDGTMPVVSPDGRYLARLTQDTRAVDIFDISTGQLMLTQKVEVSEQVHVLDRPANSALLWSRDGPLLVRQPARQLAWLDDHQCHAGSSEQLMIMHF